MPECSSCCYIQQGLLESFECHNDDLCVGAGERQKEHNSIVAILWQQIYHLKDDAGSSTASSTESEEGSMQQLESSQAYESDEASAPTFRLTPRSYHCLAGLGMRQARTPAVLHS